jgi:hypothetical protein
MPQPADIAFADQADAAEAHLARILDRTAPALLGTDTDFSEPEPWLSARLDGFAAGIASGAVQLCDHLEHGAGPRPAFGILGRPRLACTACLSELGPDADEDYHCDRCGKAVDLMEPAIATLGAVALVIVLCDRCATARRDETA